MFLEPGAMNEFSEKNKVWLNMITEKIKKD